MEAKDKKLSRLVRNWSVCTNPLRGLTQVQIDNMLQNMRLGNDIRMQIAFSLIEQYMPIFGICISKRQAGVCNRSWDILPTDDSSEAKAQADTIKRMFDASDRRNTDGLTSALRHLTLASFRGRSVVKPFVDDSGLRFHAIDNINTLQFNHKLYWNPECNMGANASNDFFGLQRLTEDEVMFVEDERPIDIPGINIYLRQLVGEEGWARFIEKCAVPQILLTAPEGTTDTALNVWNQRAIQIFEGGSGTLPNGTDVKQLTEARGQDPFTSYVDHQMEMICLLALGEKMTTLGGRSGLGSNLAEIQKTEFDNLVTYDCKRISNAINACAIAKCLKATGFTKRLCYFDFVEKENTKPDEYLNMAKLAKDIGLKIDIQKLKEVTGLSFISEIEESVWTPEER